MEKRVLTKRQRLMLDTIAGLTREYGYPPSYRELMQATGIKSPNGIRCHMLALERKGWIKVDWKCARSIRLTSKSTGIPLLSLEEITEACRTKNY